MSPVAEHRYPAPQAPPKKVRLLRASKPWSSSELAELRQYGRLGAAELARRLGRSVGSVKSAARHHRISLRRTGERRGLVLGQLRDLGLKPAVRDTLMRRRSDPPDDPDDPLCPGCGRRPIAVARSGLCRACHMNRLTEVHRETGAEIQAQRDLWREKQETKRHRDEASRERDQA